MRTCILCLPRSGSQYCERLISSLDTEVTSLGEYFEGWDDSEHSLDSNNRLYLKNRAYNNETPFSIHKKYQEKLTLLANADPEQNFTIRLFMFADYDISVLSHIVTCLQTIGFSFVALNRNFRDIAISYSIGINSLVKGKDIFGANSVLDKPIHVEVDGTRPIVNRIHDAYINRLSILQKLPITYSNVEYDTLVNDVDALFGRPTSYTGNKTLINDPSYYVVNSDEFLNFINEYD